MRLWLKSHCIYSIIKSKKNHKYTRSAFAHNPQGERGERSRGRMKRPERVAAVYIFKAAQTDPNAVTFVRC